MDTIKDVITSVPRNSHEYGLPRQLTVRSYDDFRVQSRTDTALKAHTRTSQQILGQQEEAKLKQEVQSFIRNLV